MNVSQSLLRFEKLGQLVDLKKLEWKDSSNTDQFTSNWLEEEFTVSGALDEKRQLTGRCKIMSNRGYECDGTCIAGRLTGEVTLQNLAKKQLFRGTFIEGSAIYCSEYKEGDKTIFNGHGVMEEYLPRKNFLYIPHPERHSLQIDLRCLKWEKTTKQDTFTAELDQEQLIMIGALDEAGQLTGKCTILSSTGDEFDGNFIAGELTGEATLSNLALKRHFKGRFIKGGAIYCAEYREDNKTLYSDQDLDEGRLVFVKNHPTDQGTYTGQWSEGRPSGKGKMVYTSSPTYEGTWEKGKREGEGIYQYTMPGSGYILFRSYKCGLIEFRGNWKGDQPEGEGDLTLGCYGPIRINLKGLWSQIERSFKGYCTINNDPPSRLEIEWTNYIQDCNARCANFLIFDGYGDGKLKIDSCVYEGELYGLNPNIKGGREYKSVYEYPDTVQSYILDRAVLAGDGDRLSLNDELKSQQKPGCLIQ